MASIVFWRSARWLRRRAHLNVLKEQTSWPATWPSSLLGHELNRAFRLARSSLCACTYICINPERRLLEFVLAGDPGAMIVVCTTKCLFIAVAKQQSSGPNPTRPPKPPTPVTPPIPPVEEEGPLRPCSISAVEEEDLPRFGFGRLAAACCCYTVCVRELDSMACTYVFESRGGGGGERPEGVSGSQINISIHIACDDTLARTSHSSHARGPQGSLGSIRSLRTGEPFLCGLPAAAPCGVRSNPWLADEHLLAPEGRHGLARWKKFSKSQWPSTR